MAGRSPFLTTVLPLAAVIALGGAAYSIGRNAPDSRLLDPVATPATQPSLPVAQASMGFIGAGGLVEPSSEEFAIGTSLSGVVAAVFVKPGDRVRRGEPLFKLDDRTAQAELANRQRQLLQAQRRRDHTLAQIPIQQAQVDAARARLAQAETDLAEARDQQRISDTLTARESAAVSERQVTHRRNATRSAEARRDEAKAQLATAQAQLALYERQNAPVIEVDAAAIDQTQAVLRQAQIALELLTVTAPIDGTVLQTNVRAGEFAQAGVLATPLIRLGALDPLHVAVEIDEADLGRLDPAVPATASPRGQAGVRIPLTFVRIDPIVVPKQTLTGASTEQVDTRVLRAIYAFDPKGLEVFPGQQVDVLIEARRAPANGSPAADQGDPRRTATGGAGTSSPP